MLAAEISKFTLVLEMCGIKLLLSEIRAALALSSCLLVFALQKQHVMLGGKCLTQFICCLVRKKLLKT